ncbi:MAG: transposase family protein [Terriglobia bacterium]
MTVLKPQSNCYQTGKPDTARLKDNGSTNRYEGGVSQNHQSTEEPLRYHRTFGLNSEQLDELEERISELLAEPWDKGVGRPKSLSLREAIIVTLLYARQNMTEEVIADVFGVSQGTISGAIASITPLIAKATEKLRPDADEAKRVTCGRIVLVDGTLWPCWSWETAPELWAGKYKTTGHGSLIISDESGGIIFVSDPAPGREHDMNKLEGTVKEILELAGSVVADKGFQGSGYVTPVKKPADRDLYLREHEYNNQVSSIRSPIERAVAHLKTWKILFTDYRRPLCTFLDSFRAAIGLYFFELSF